MSDFPKNAKVQWSVMGGGCVRDLNHKDSFLLTSLAQISLIRSRFLGCHTMLHPTKCCVMTLKRLRRRLGTDLFGDLLLTVFKVQYVVVVW